MNFAVKNVYFKLFGLDSHNITIMILLMRHNVMHYMYLCQLSILDLKMASFGALWVPVGDASPPPGSATGFL